MTAAVGTPEPRSVVARVEAAQARSRTAFRLKFAATWVVLIGLILFGLGITGNIDTGFIAEWGPFIVGGTSLTVLISVVSISIATVLALVGSLGRISRNPYVNGLASLYVSLARGTPLIVQILFVYLALPQVGIVLPAIPAGLIALSFNYGAYMTEIFRAGIEAVPRGQREAAEALGIPDRVVMRRIVLPQAVRIVIPAIGNEFIAMIKDSSLVSILAVEELLFRARLVGQQNFRSLEALIIAAAIYWILTIAFSQVQQRLERRLARGDR
jgi:polar amino acid transport system permease protein